MKRRIEKVAVLGSGVMGSGIAAHLANVGIPCYMLDIVPKELTPKEEAAGLTLDSPKVRNRIAATGLQNALKARPAAFHTKKNAELITVGNFDDNMDWLSEVDWIVEVVIENLEIKQRVFKNVEKYRKDETIVSSNTSGIPIKGMVEGLSQGMREHFLVTHFFNPVRYMNLLELVAGEDTDAEIMEFMADFGERVLGKGIVFGKDTPNFIANRIGIQGSMCTLKTALEMGYKVEEVDRIFGPALGRPKSAVLRTADIVGLDTMLHVAKNVYASLPDDESREIFKPPEIMEKLVEKGALGQKSGAGFYKRTKVDGKKAILALDLDTLEYREQEKVRIDSLGAARNIEDPAERIKTVVFADDRAGEFAWRVITDGLLYAARRIPEIADDIVNVDNAMKWGYNMELGPFETWDALGVKETVDRLEKEGKEIPENVRKVLEKGDGKFYHYADGKRSYFDFATETYKAVPASPNVIVLKSEKDRNKIVKRNPGAILIEIGDGVLCLEFQTKMNSVDDDIVQMIFDGVDEMEQNWEAMVIGNEGQAFSVGANLMLLLMNARAGNFDDIEKVVKAFQDACMRLKYSDKPVVAAPFSMALGGGCEVSMGADRIHAAAETYMGQVELGVGLIPGGGGTKELLVRHIERVPAEREFDIEPYVQRAINTIAMATVSTSAEHARELGFLRPTDKVSANKAHLIHDAKQTALAMVKEGYVRPRPRTDIRVPGEDGYATIKVMLRTMKWSHYISDHDELIASKLAYVMTGGKASPHEPVSEQYLLDLERETFVSLCGEEKSQQRMEHMLTAGKPLRN